MGKKVNFHTLGCKLNFSESSTIARQFEQGGFERVSPTDAADICIINSCSVTEHADKKCRNIIRKLHRRNPDAIIAVTGCYAQLKPYEIAEIEGVDIVLSNNNKGETYQRVLELTKRGKTQVYSCETDQITTFFSAFSSGDRTRAFLKVQDGCDYCCSYCTIHNARGSSRNIPIAEVVSQAEAIVAGGQKEIVITGVNTGDFGRTTGESFADLLRALDKVEGVERYRISSIEPNLLTDEIIDICARSSKFQHHFHIPIQCGSNKILALMRRRYTVEKFADRIAAVKRAMPDAFIGIDVITGFPGETDADFASSRDFLESIEPAFLHIFPFSERANTPAVELPNKVQSSVSTARVKELEELSNRLHYQFCSKALGKVTSVLFESTERGGFMTGFTGNYIKVKVPYNRKYINQIVDVKLLSIESNCDVIGQIIEVE
jgi:threonylcarbamoyladenosine tRNA methylthiotransferase MtaB